MPDKKPLVLILGTAEWSSPIATNQHYVTRELAKEFDILFAEGVGTRRPSLSKNDLKRIAKRIAKVVRPGAGTISNTTERPVPERAKVLSPFAVPFHISSITPINSRLLARSFAEWINYDGPKVLWSYTPFTYGLELQADFTVYHLVDLLHENPGANKADIFRGERALARTADLAIATSPAIGEHLKAQGFKNVEVKLNVADVEVFEAARGVPKEDPPVVIFAGNLRADKLDVELLIDLARVLKGKATLRLIGPSGLEPGERNFLDDLRAEGADIRGPLSLEDLAAEVAKSTVGIIPYRINALTKGISPLKTYEYLAAGIPVVSTPLPSMGGTAMADIYLGGGDFAKLVLSRLATNLIPTDHVSMSWSSRGSEFRTLIRSAPINRSRSAL